MTESRHKRDREDKETMKNQDKTELFEKMAVPAAVRQLIIPTIISSLITIIYNLGTPILWACSTILYRMPPSLWWRR